ncbi:MULTISPECIES: RHS repeat-associated core domain-containing protein, partial [unclassified Neisseria]
DGSHLLQEVHPDGRYTYLYTDPDSYEPLAQVCNWTNEDGESKQQTHYFHCDQIGIPREMTDKDGNLLWFGNYTGWGRLKEETKVTYNAYQPFRLQNQYADRETGLHYNFFRYYEPDAGRFVNQDPIGLAGGSNLYWALQNSQMWADPLGLSSKKSPGTCNDPCAGQDPAGEAAGWQGSKDYPGVDNWKNVVLEKGTILFTLYPHGPAGMASAPGNYFVRGYAVRSARGNARAFNDSVQVRHSGNANAARDMRKQLHIFVVEEDICVGKSKAKANKKYGDGGATQYYIRDIDKPKLTSTGKLRSFRR